MAVKYWVGGTGNWSTAGRWSTSPGAASFTASRPSGTNATLTVTAVQSGTIASGQLLYDSSGTARGTINAQLSGTTGGVGTYSTIASSSTITSQACYTMVSGSTTTVPASGSTDEIVFDGNSGLNPTVTVTTTGYAGSVYIGNVGSLYISGFSSTSNINGTLTITGTSTLNIYDNLKIASSGSSVNWSHSGTLNFTTRGGNISAPNTNISSSIVVPSGTWTLVGNMGNTVASGTLSFTGGTINLGTYTWTCGTASITGSSAKVLNFGTSGKLALSYSYFYSLTNVLNITSSFTQLSLTGTDPTFVTTGVDQKSIDFTSSTWYTNNSNTNPYPGIRASGGALLYQNSGAGASLNSGTFYIRSIDLTGSTGTAQILPPSSGSVSYLTIKGDLIAPESMSYCLLGTQSYFSNPSAYFTGSNNSLHFNPGPANQVFNGDTSGAGVSSLSAIFSSGCNYTQTGPINFSNLGTSGTGSITLNSTGKLYATNNYIYLSSGVTLIGDIDASEFPINDSGFNSTSLTSLKTYYYGSSNSKSFPLTLVKRKNTAVLAKRTLTLIGSASLSSITFSDPYGVGTSASTEIYLNGVTLPSAVNWTATSLTLYGNITIPADSVFNLQDTPTAAVNLTASTACSTPVTVNVNLTNAVYSSLYSDNTSNNLTLNITGNNASSKVRFRSASYFDSIDFTGFYGIYASTYYDSYYESWDIPIIYVKKLFKITASTQFTNEGFLSSYSWIEGISSTEFNIFAILTYGSDSCTINIPSSTTVGGIRYKNNITFINPFILNSLVLKDSDTYTVSQGTYPVVSNYYVKGTATLNLGNSSSSINSIETTGTATTVNLNTATSSIQNIYINGTSSTINFNSSAVNITSQIYQTNNDPTSPNIINFNSSTPTINTINSTTTIVNFNTSSPTITGNITSTAVVNFGTSSPTINNITFSNNAICYIGSGSAVNCTGSMSFQDNAYLDATNATFSVKNLTNVTSYNTSIYTGSTVNLSGILNDNFSSFNNIVVKSSAVTIGAYYIENLSNTVAPSTVKFSTPVKISNFNLQGTLGNLVTVTSSDTAQRYLMKPSAWNVGSNSQNSGNNFGINLSAGTNDYLNFSYIIGIDTSLANKLTATQTQQIMQGSSTGSYAYAGNVLELLIKGNRPASGSGYSYYTYNIVVPTGATVNYYATVMPSSRQYYDGGYEGSPSGDRAYLVIDNVNKFGEVSGLTQASTTGTLSVGTHTLYFDYGDTDGTSNYANKDLARLFVYFYAVLPSGSNKFLLMF